MKVKNIGLALGLAILGSVFAATSAQALTTFTDWNFSTLPTTPSGTSNNNPAATTGTGTASVLGMNNSYNNTTSVAFADILSDPGSSNGGTNAWRVRGQNPGNGWSTSAPEYTQGAEFDTSTVGYSNIVLTYDFIPTTSGIADIQTQYTTDGVNWTNIGPVEVATSSTTWDNGITIDLSSITSVNNDPSFGVRLVSAYAPGTSTYETATGGTISNTAGNVRFNNIAFSGTPTSAAVPFDFDPAYGVVLGVPLFIGLRVAKKKLL